MKHNEDCKCPLCRIKDKVFDEGYKFARSESLAREIEELKQVFNYDNVILYGVKID